MATFAFDQLSFLKSPDGWEFSRWLLVRRNFEMITYGTKYCHNLILSFKTETSKDFSPEITLTVVYQLVNRYRNQIQLGDKGSELELTEKIELYF